MNKFGIKLVKGIDYFNQPIELLFSGKKKFATILGGILSIMMYAVTIAIILSMSSDLISRKNPKTTMTNMYLLSAPLLNMSERKMVYATFFLDSTFTYFNDPSYMTFNLYQFQVIRKGEDQTVRYLPINFTNCTMYLKYFKELGFEADFFSNGLHKAFCFDNSDIVIGGNFYSEYFSNILVRVEKCKNTTNTNTLCKTDAEITSKLKGGTFELYYVNKYIDLNNFTNPYIDYFANYFVLLDPLSKKMVDVYFKLSNISSDVGLIFEDKNIGSEVMLDYIREQFSTAEKDEKLVDFYINSSNNVLVYTRIYLKFQELAATVGGILKVLIIIGYAVTYFPTEYQIYETIINTLFKIKQKKHSASVSNFIKSINVALHKDNNVFKDLNRFAKNPNNNLLLSNSVVGPQSLNQSNINQQPSVIHILNDKPSGIHPTGKHSSMNVSVKVKNEINEKINALTSQLAPKYKLGMLSILSINCFSYCARSSKKQAELFNVLYVKMTKYLDYLSIIQILQQFHKLKKILFSKHQRKLFSFSNVPIIREGQTVMKKKENSEKYYDMYVKYLIAKKNEDNISQKLIENFDCNLRIIFDNIEKENWSVEQEV